MRRHAIALTLSIVLLLVSSLILSCVPTASSKSSEPTDGIAYKSDVTGLGDRIDAQSTRIDNIAGKSGVSQSDVQNMINSALADYAKKSDVIAAVQALKDEHPWTTSSTHITPAGTTAGEYGELVDTNGDLELWLEKVGGDADSEQLYTYKGDSSRANFDFVVANKDSSSHAFRITITFMPDDKVTTSGETAGADNGLIFTLSSARTADTEDDMTFKSNDRRVSGNNTESFRVIVNASQPTVPSQPNIVNWSINFDITDKG